MSFGGFGGPLGSTLGLPIYGKVYSSAFVNTNGLISYGSSVSSFVPQPFPISSTALVAPFWADADTRGTASGQVWYRATQDAATLDAIGAQLYSSYLGLNAENFRPKFAQIVTWDRVGYYPSMTDKLNTFQAVVVTDGAATFALYLYPQGGINWLQGSASGGALPRYGFDAGDQVNFLNGVGSGTSSVLNLPSTSNAVPASPGVHVFPLGYLGSIFLSSGNSPDVTFTTGQTIPAGTILSSRRLTVGASLQIYGGSAAETLRFNELVFSDPSLVLSLAGTCTTIANATNAISHGNVVLGQTTALVAYATGALSGGNVTLRNGASLHLWTNNAITGGATLTFDNGTAGAAGVGGTLDMRGFDGAFRIQSVGTNAGVITSTLAGERTLTLTSEGPVLVNGVPSTVTRRFGGRIEDGAGVLRLVKEGGDTLILAGANTYSGGTVLAGGVVTVSSDANLGAAAGPLTLGGGTLRATAGFGSSRPLSVEAGESGLIIDSGETLTWSGEISGGGALRKSGEGAFVVSGTHTFSGQLTAASGGVVVNGDMRFGSLLIESGATLSGGGRLGEVTVAGRIAPGNSAGALAVDTLVWAAGGMYDWELVDAAAGAGAGWDKISAGQGLTVTATAENPFVIRVGSLLSASGEGALGLLPGSVFEILSIGGSFAGLAAGTVVLDTTGLGGDASEWRLIVGEDNLSLAFGAIPEPGSFALLAGGLSLAFCLGQGRRARVQAGRLARRREI